MHPAVLDAVLLFCTSAVLLCGVTGVGGRDAAVHLPSNVHRTSNQAQTQAQVTYASVAATTTDARQSARTPPPGPPSRTALLRPVTRTGARLQPIDYVDLAISTGGFGFGVGGDPPGPQVIQGCVCVFVCGGGGDGGCRAAVVIVIVMVVVVMDACGCCGCCDNCRADIDVIFVYGCGGYLVIVVVLHWRLYGWTAAVVVVKGSFG